MKNFFRLVFAALIAVVGWIVYLLFRPTPTPSQPLPVTVNRTYTDHDYNLSFSKPSGWSGPALAFYGPSSGDTASTQPTYKELAFTLPDKTTVAMDVSRLDTYQNGPSQNTLAALQNYFVQKKVDSLSPALQLPPTKETALNPSTATYVETPDQHWRGVYYYYQDTAGYPVATLNRLVVLLTDGNNNAVQLVAKAAGADQAKAQPLPSCALSGGATSCQASLSLVNVLDQITTGVLPTLKRI